MWWWDADYYVNENLTRSRGSCPLGAQQQGEHEKTQRVHVSPSQPYREMNKSGREDGELRGEGGREGGGEGGGERVEG